MPKLLLVDGHSQAYRAYFGLKTPLTTRSGEPTTAVFGFTRKLLSLLRETQPDYVGVAFDTGDTWRHQEFSDYKATRDSMPDDMRSQMKRIEQILRAFNIPIITYTNFEADDILGTLARQAAAHNIEVLILTGDRDLFQLIAPNVNILYTQGGPNPQTVQYGLDQLSERYSLTPEQFVDLKALTGDSSDNIPGVVGVGEKTAVKFLNQYETIANLYAHVDQIGGPKTRQNLIDAKSIVERNKRLMTIVTDLDLKFDANEYLLKDFDLQTVIEVFNELEFRSLVKEITGIAGAMQDTPDDNAAGQMALFVAESAEPAPPQGQYEMITTEEQLSSLVAKLRAAELISFDVETTSTDAMQADLVGLGLSWQEDAAAYIPIAHQDGIQLRWEIVRDQLRPIMADPTIDKVAHNAKYDLTVCLRYGLEVQGAIHDTMIMAWLLDPASRNLGLKDQAALELGWQMTEITSLIGSGRKQITIDKVPIEQAGIYCCADVDATIRLYAILAKRLQTSEMWQLYLDLEVPLIPVLTDMEMAGILLDLDFLREMSDTLSARLSELEQELFQIVGHEFNLRSTQQLSQVLFDELMFPTKGMRRTSSGFYSTAVSTLEQLAAQSDSLTDNQNKVLDIIFEQRQLEKLRGTYVDALPTLVNPQTGRLHTSYNQTGAVTGRMSSSNPNLQNIPIRTELGREIRRGFIAPQQWRLIAADYSQVELRILAHVAQETALIESFLADQDIHVATAARLFDVELDAVSREQRSLAKTINFATIYGVSAFGLSSRTEMSHVEARQFLDQYFQTYPRIKTYISDTIAKANEDGCVETLLGRKRYFLELSNRRLPHNQRQAIERAAINAPIQGTAADIMKIAMIRLHKQLQSDDFSAHILLQVHDELVLEAPEEEVEPVAALVREVMQSAYQLAVPLKVDIEFGRDWYNLESI